MMARIAAWWASGPSHRTMAILLIGAAAALLARWAVAAPMFSQEMGFVPFDLQPRLNQGMLVIQLGAARGHPLGALYGAFVMADIPVSLVLAFVTVAFWRWLHVRTPNRVYAFLTAGGVMLLPIVAAMLEMTEHRAVFSLLYQRVGEAYADAIAFTVSVHNVKVAMADLRDAVTLSFMASTAVLALLRRKLKRAPQTPPEQT